MQRAFPVLRLLLKSFVYGVSSIFKIILIYFYRASLASPASPASRASLASLACLACLACLYPWRESKDLVRPSSSLCLCAVGVSGLPLLVNRYKKAGL